MSAQVIAFPGTQSAPLAPVPVKAERKSTSPARRALERHATHAARVSIEKRLLTAREECTRKFPASTTVSRKRGCTEVVWESDTPLALATQDALAVAVSVAVRGVDDALGEAMVRAAWTQFVRARMRVWREGKASWKYETPAELER